MLVDPSGEIHWVIIVVAGIAIVVAIIVLPDWDAESLAPGQAFRVQKLIENLIKCAKIRGDTEIVTNLEAMTVTGIFEPQSSGRNGPEDDISETRRARTFFGIGRTRTILAADFFNKPCKLQMLRWTPKTGRHDKVSFPGLGTAESGACQHEAEAAGVWGPPYYPQCWLRSQSGPIKIIGVQFR